MKTINLKSVIKDTSQNWIADNPTLSKGNISYETDTDLIKLYDGEHSYNELPYLNAGGGAGGTTNYNVLSNKPQINSVVLTGNKTLEDLGIPNITTVSSIQTELTALHNDFDAIDSEVGDKADNDMVVHKKGFESGEIIENPKEFTGLVTLTGNADLQIGDMTNAAATANFVTLSVDDLRNNSPSSTNVDAKIAEHNLSPQAHNDIRNSVKAVSDSLAVKANLASQENGKIGNIAIVDKDGQYEVSDTKLSDLNTDIDTLNQQTGLLTTSINDIKDDYASKTKDNTFTGKNTLNGDVVLGANIRNKVNDKVIVTTKTIDANTQATYVGGDEVEVYAPDSLSIESESIIIKRNNESGVKTDYTNIDSGNVNGVVSTAIAADATIARTNVGNTFSVRNTFSNGINITGGAFGLTMNATPITLMNSSAIQDNGSTTLLMALESQNKTYLGGKNEIWANAPDKIMLQTGSLTTKRNDTEYTVIDSGNVADYVSQASAPENMVTTDTEQTITSKKTFNANVNLSKSSHITITGTPVLYDHSYTSDGVYHPQVSTGNANYELQLVSKVAPIVTRVTGENLATTDYVNIDSGNISEYVSGGSSEMDKYGIEADYAVHYGIIDCPQGLIEFNTTNKNVTIKAGIVLQAAGQSNRTTIGSDIIYTVQETGKITLFYTKTGDTVGIIEAGEVFYQESEPSNGSMSYLAWWKPSLGKWQFKSNDTGNVWREAIATPIADVNTGASTIISITYIGYRIFDDDCFASLSDIESVQDSIDEIFTEVAKKQDGLLSRQLLTGTIETVAPVAENADLITLITSFNNLLTKLKSRGVIS